MSKALFVGHDQVSHAHDTFFNGCIKLFGGQNVFDFPCFPKNHSDYKHSHSYAWWCYNNTNHILSLTMDDWAKEINDRKIKYIVGNNREMNNFVKILQKINLDTFEDICVLFIEEEGDPGFEVHRHCLEYLKDVYNKIDIHYKMDYIRTRCASYDKIFPFYMSAPVDKICGEVDWKIKKFEDRQYDVSYLVGASHSNRKMYYDILQHGLKQGNNLILYGDHKFSLKEYFNIINNSKIFISARGNEWSNTRNLEGPVLGAALFTERLEIEIPFEYIDGESAVFYDRDNLISKLYEYLNDIDKLKNLAMNSNLHAMKYHTSVERAQQFVDLAKKIKGW